jgi:hypothetical protein
MDPSFAGLLASGAQHGPTFLGEDLVGWRTALIAAIPAAIAYEMVMALTRKITLRIPFLILYIAKIGLSKEDWGRLHAEWKAELWFILRDGDTHWLIRFITGMRYSVPLAFGGARLTASASGEAARTESVRGPAVTYFSASGGVGVVGSMLWTLDLPLWIAIPGYVIAGALVLVMFKALEAKRAISQRNRIGEAKNGHGE